MPNSTPSQQSLAVFEQYKQAINQSLIKYFDNLPSQFVDIELPMVDTTAVKLIAEYTLRPGKRIRGVLAAMAYDHMTDKRLSAVGLQLGVAMELIQSYLLIVDDITDRSNLRRGEPTVHRLYEQIYENEIDEREAEQLAVYTSMITGHLAQALVVRTDEQPGHIVRAIQALNDNIVTTGFGQLDDVMQEIMREASASDIVRKYSLKTSYYTYINPLHTGIALAGVTDQATYDTVTAFGLAAGVAFQTHDDYLGIFGTEETGKPTTDDVREGKVTILTEFALSHGSPEDVKTLKSYLGNPSFDDEDLLNARAIFDKTGATMEARRVAKQYADAAIAQLQSITIWDESFKTQLAELVRYSISRES